jgi:hypothetical protein
MADFVVAIPDLIAERFVATVDWVREHVDRDFDFSTALVAAITDWTSDMELEFVLDDSGGANGTNGEDACEG